MNTPCAEQKEKFIGVGGIYATSEPFIIKTVLGSCVAVVLWDADHRIGGMNHFIHPLWNGSDKNVNLYGDQSVRHLISRFYTCGAKSVRASIYGGAGMFSRSNVTDVGAMNVKVALTALHEADIPVIAEQTGGRFGRRIAFDIKSGEVRVITIAPRLIDDEQAGA